VICLQGKYFEFIAIILYDSFSMENIYLGERWILGSMEKEKIRIKQVRPWLLIIENSMQSTTLKVENMTSFGIFLGKSAEEHALTACLF